MLLPILFLAALQGCSADAPSDGALKSSASLADHQNGEILDLQKYDKLDLSNKKCILSNNQKVANCTFMLNNKSYDLKFYATGSDWSYAGRVRS